MCGVELPREKILGMLYVHQVVGSVVDGEAGHGRERRCPIT